VSTAVVLEGFNSSAPDSLVRPTRLLVRPDSQLASSSAFSSTSGLGLTSPIGRPPSPSQDRLPSDNAFLLRTVPGLFQWGMDADCASLSMFSSWEQPFPN